MKSESKVAVKHTIKHVPTTLKALVLITSLLVLMAPKLSEAVSANVLSDTTWTVSFTDSNGATHFLGNAQNICLNANAPQNCPAGATLYGYQFLGWTADLSQIPVMTKPTWIWAPTTADGQKITGSTTSAANSEFTFEAVFYLCGNTPKDGTIYLAAADVYLNGVKVASSTDHTTLSVVTVPAAQMPTASEGY